MCASAPHTRMHSTAYKHTYTFWSHVSCMDLDQSRKPFLAQAIAAEIKNRRRTFFRLFALHAASSEYFIWLSCPHLYILSTFFVSFATNCVHSHRLVLIFFCIYSFISSFGCVQRPFSSSAAALSQIEKSLLKIPTHGLCLFINQPHRHHQHFHQVGGDDMFSPYFS